jgi:tetratricopeptide (TPR) repeat protein
MLALCLLELERFGPATEHAQLAVGQAPDWDFAHYALARVWAERNRDAQALAAIDEALRLDPEDPDYCAFKAGVLVRGEYWPEVLAWSDRGLALDAEHVGCQNLRDRGPVSHAV